MPTSVAIAAGTWLSLGLSGYCLLSGTFFIFTAIKQRKIENVYVSGWLLILSLFSTGILSAQVANMGAQYLLAK